MWRIHYWILKKDQIFRLAAIPEEKRPQEDELASIYERMSQEVWSNRSSSQAE